MGELLACEWGVLCVPPLSSLLQLTPDHRFEHVLNWMKVRLNGGPFASVLDTDKIVCEQPLPKKLLDLLQLLPPGQMADRTEQIG